MAGKNTARYQTPHSDWLREGLSNTLLMISVLGKQASVEIGADNGKAFVDGIVSRLSKAKGRIVRVHEIAFRNRNNSNILQKIF